MSMINVGNSQTQHAYEIAAEIGKGAYGTVYKARDMTNHGQFVALKEIRILARTEEGMPMSTIREIAMLRQLEKFEHPNIVRLLDVWVGHQTLHEMKLMLVFEHIDQDLAQYLEKSPSCGLSPDNIKDLMKQILKGVDFLHTNRIIHRDLKPQNILVSSQGRVKIADFGLARIYAFSMALTTVVVTLYYRSPEVLLQDTYCSSVDIWSCGTILAELYLKKPLFQGTSEIDQLCKIFDIMSLPLESDWPASRSLPRSSFKEKPKQPFHRLMPSLDRLGVHLLESLLLFDQSKRISAAAALKHAWFTDDTPVVTLPGTTCHTTPTLSRLHASLLARNTVAKPIITSETILDVLVADEDLPTSPAGPGNLGAVAMVTEVSDISTNETVTSICDISSGSTGLGDDNIHVSHSSFPQNGAQAVSGGPSVQPSTTTLNQAFPPPSTMINHPQSPTTMINHPQPPTTMINHPQPPTTMINHPQPQTFVPTNPRSTTFEGHVQEHYKGPPVTVLSTNTSVINVPRPSPPNITLSSGMVFSAPIIVANSTHCKPDVAHALCNSGDHSFGSDKQKKGIKRSRPF